MGTESDEEKRLALDQPFLSPGFATRWRGWRWMVGGSCSLVSTYSK
jgi:hypothetical protein